MVTRLLIFGASITQGYHDDQGGWADRLKRELLSRDKQIAVFNLGISGDKTADVLRRFNSEVEARTKRWDTFESTAIIIAVGTNDTYREGNNAGPITSKNDFANSFRRLIQAAQKQAGYVLICSILPFDESKTAPVTWRNITYLNETANDYSKQLRTICEDLGAIFIDLNSMAKEVDWPSMLDDGVHPNRAGHKWIFEEVLAEVNKL